MPSHAGGDRTTANKLNTPIFRGRQIATQTLTTGLWAPATFTAESYDTHTGHSTSVNTDQYVVPTIWGGVWRCSGGGTFAANATGSRGARWTKNGTPILNAELMLPNNGAGTASRIPAHTISEDFAAGDVIRLELFQDRGGNLDTVVSSEIGCFMDLEFLRKI